MLMRDGILNRCVYGKNNLEQFVLIYLAIVLVTKFNCGKLLQTPASYHRGSLKLFFFSIYGYHIISILSTWPRIDAFPILKPGLGVLIMLIT